MKKQDRLKNKEKQKQNYQKPNQKMPRTTTRNLKLILKNPIKKNY